jgi:hypothetical protein
MDSSVGLLSLLSVPPESVVHSQRDKQKAPGTSRAYKSDVTDASVMQTDESAFVLIKRVVLVLDQGVHKTNKGYDSQTTQKSHNARLVCEGKVSAYAFPAINR